jgi:hypothetical protein
MRHALNGMADEVANGRMSMDGFPAQVIPIMELQELQQKLGEALHRIERLEEQMHSVKGSARWQHLVLRPHPWRRQLSLRDRNMTVGQLMSIIRPNRLTPEQASADLDLPVEAIQETIAYYEENRELIRSEASKERQYLGSRT